MTGAGPPPPRDAGPDARMQARLARLLAARLALTLALFGAAALLQAGAAVPEGAVQGVYGTLAVAFLSTAALASLLRRIERIGTFTALQVPVDAVLVTALVLFTGADESLFAFLYVLVVVYGALLAGRPGAFASALLCASLHGTLLLAVQLETLPDYGSATAAGAPTVWVTWSVHSGALLVVGLLASSLSRELESADAALDASRDHLRDLRNLHERIVESLLSGLLTTDPAGRITSLNGEGERITGVPWAEARGRDVDELIPGARARVVGPALAGVAPGRLRLRLPFRNRRGEDLHLGLAASVLRDAGGTSFGAVVIFQDVTRVVEMEGELRRSERLAATGRLAADIAHEVRNPLAAISGSIQMMLGGAGGASPETAPLMEIVLRETDRLNALITDFLQYAHPRPPKREAVDLRAVADEVVRMLENSAHPGPAPALEVDVEPGLRVHADPGQLRQLLWNLCTNAVQAMPGGGRLVVGAGRAPGPAQATGRSGRNDPQTEGSGWVEIRVADTGVGIAPDASDRIFDPFFTTKESGTGLGLATVHRIVEAHGGVLRVESAVGVGTTIRIGIAEAPGSGASDPQTEEAGEPT